MGLRARRTDRETLEDLVNKTEVIDNRCEYVSDENKAVMLISGLIPHGTAQKISTIDSISDEIDDLFAQYSEITFTDELEIYRKLSMLCDRLKEQQKISDKVVVGFGGQFSAGKSAFINSISGLGNLLPEAQKPTTSIPTYIIKGVGSSTESISFSAMTNMGVSVPLDKQKMQAMTHEFHEEYGIGFSAFIESVTIETRDFRLPSNVALLDTPGYSKSDSKSDSKNTYSDKQKAEKQLRTANYLIWLVDIDNGVIKQEDIKFIQTLEIINPILIVLNKADKKTDEDISSIIATCQQTVIEHGINCFGIAAYSSREHKEYTNGIISDFFTAISRNQSEEMKRNDIRAQFRQTELSLFDTIWIYRNTLRRESTSLWNSIKAADKFIDVSSFAKIWGDRKMRYKDIKRIASDTRARLYQINKLIDSLYQDDSCVLTKDIDSYIQSQLSSY